MDSFGIEVELWCKHLAPILNPDASEVYLDMESEDPKTMKH